MQLMAKSPTRQQQQTVEQEQGELVVATPVPDGLVVQVRTHLSLEVQQLMSRTTFEDGLTSAMAQLAAHELCNAASQRDRIEWFDRVMRLKDRATKAGGGRDAGTAAKFEAARKG